MKLTRNPSFPGLARRIRHAGASRAFSLIELLVVVGIIVLLIAILMPVLASTRAAGRAAVCSSNLHQIAQGFRNFKNNEGRNPQTTEVLFGLSAYMSGASREVFLCPEAVVRGQRSFGVNACVSKITEPSTVVMLDAHTKIIYYEGTSSEVWQASVAPRHPADSMNVLTYGGSVERWQSPPLNPYESTQVLLKHWKTDRQCDPAPGQGGNCGVCAIYYTDWWKGESAVRMDNTLHMPFGGAFFGENSWDIPLPGTNPGGWDTGSFGSGVWFGKIKADETANYTFHVACDNEAWLYLGGQEILHRSTGGVDGVTTYQASATVSLKAGEWYDIEVRLRELTPGSSPSHISVKWSTGGAAQEIPCENLRPG